MFEIHFEKEVWIKETSCNLFTRWLIAGCIVLCCLWSDWFDLKTRDNYPDIVLCAGASGATLPTLGWQVLTKDKSEVSFLEVEWVIT